MSQEKHCDVLILGAGLSGLSAGFELNKKKKNYLILEADAKSGGVIQTREKDGLVIEHGPNSLILTAEIKDLLQQLNLEQDIILARQEAGIRQILWNDELHALKPSPLTLIKTNLLSFAGKCRILKELFIKSTSPDGETVHDFFERRFGIEVAQRMAGAIVSGIYAGDARELEMSAVFPRLIELEKKYGSVLKGLRKSKSAGREIITLKGGLGNLTSQLSRKQNNNIHYNCNITSISRKSTGWQVVTENGVIYSCSTLLSTLPAPAISILMPDDFPKININYNPMLTLQARVDLKELERTCQGFGFLASRSERKDLIGVMFNALVFETARNADYGLINFFVRPDETVSTNPDDIFNDLCVPNFKKWTAYESDLQLLSHKNWIHAIPQKISGHTVLLSRLNDWERQEGNIHIGGNFVSGVSLGDCIKYHQDLSTAIS